MLLAILNVKLHFTVGLGAQLLAFIVFPDKCA